VFEVSTTLVMLAFAAVLVWQGRAASRSANRAGSNAKVPIPKTPISMNENTILGSRTARVAVVEYSDFQCPFCTRVARRVMPTLVKEYVESGQVMIAFKHLPLEIHKNAPSLAAAAFCAGDQQKFWPGHDAIFADPSKLSDADIRGRLVEVGLSVGEYDACRTGPRAAAQIAADTAEARALHITATPTFLIGKVQEDGKVRVVETVQGAVPVEELKQLIDRVIKG
jgi:protein-disulfide isomerase